MALVLGVIVSPPNLSALTQLENARLDAIDANYAEMSVRDCVPTKEKLEQILCNGKSFQIKINDLALRA